MEPGTTSERSQSFDASRAAAFSDRMVEVLNAGALTVALSIGHRSGLLDVMGALPPSTSQEIADAAGLDERYVREWLGVVACGGVVEVDDAGRFRLPAEHAACLTRAAAPDDLAAFAQYIPLAGTVEDRILECFRDGGGVAYSEFTRFQELMAEESGQTVLPVLLTDILPIVPGLTARLERGIDVLDVGCGRGLAMMLLAESFPASRFRGYDFSPEGVAFARETAAERGLGNLAFEERDVAQIGDRDAFDLITAFDAIHDQRDPARVLANIAGALRPGGVFLMQDVAASSDLRGNLDHPLGSLLYMVSLVHCMTVSLALGGAGLGTMWGRERASAMLADAGFSEVQITALPHDPQNEYYVCRTGR